MDRERYARVREILLAALDAPEYERDAFAAAQCQGDDELLEQVRALLHQETRSALRDPRPPKLGEQMPRRVGPYRIQEILGVGGMGAVYRAEQTEPIRRTVAIKLIRGGLASEHAVARFEIERQVLASLNHPNIAQVYDAGSTGDGLPYFAMELVEGDPITEYCSRRALDTRQRIELFVEVCRAVQHAHNKGVIHRDLKPSNILVTERQTLPVPKVIDFGIAKALDVSDDYITMATRDGQLVGTLEYMSPEQASGGSMSVDTRSDVYALGVMLYQLIAERLPYELNGLSAVDAVQTLVHRTPSKLTFATTGVGARRDLETIVMKSLEKEPARRYESAAALAADLDRFLKGEPIAARPPSATYQFKRLVTRHKVVVGFATALVVVLASFGIGMSILYSRQQVARHAAVEQAERAAEIGDYLSEMIKSVDLVNDGPDFTVAELLEKVAKNVDEDIANPEVRVAVRRAIGGGFYSLGRYREAAEHFGAALEILRSQKGTPPEEMFDLLDSMVSTYYYLNEFDRAIESCREIVRLRSQYAPDSPGLAVTLSNLGRLLMFNWRFDEAMDAMERSVATHERNGEKGTNSYLVAFSGIAMCYAEAGDYERALRANGESIRMRREYLGNDNTWTLSACGADVNNLRQLGRFAEADSVFNTYRTQLKGLAVGDEMHLASALLQLDLRNTREAVNTMRQAMALREERVGAGSPRMYWFTLELANVLLEAGHAVAALSASSDAVQQGSQSPHRDHPNAALTLSVHGACLSANGRHAEAEAILREAIAVFERYDAANHWRAVEARVRLGQCLAAAGRWSEASALLEEIRPSLSRLPYGTRARSLRRIAELYNGHDEYDTATVYRAELATLSETGVSATR